MSGKFSKREVDCRQVMAAVDLLAAGDLHEEKQRLYLRHLESCPACKTEYERVVAVTAAIQEELGQSPSLLCEMADLWPTVRQAIRSQPRRRFGLGWLSTEPVRFLTAAAVLTVGLFLLINGLPWNGPNRGLSACIYESTPVAVSAARINGRSARVSGFESADGETVFLWLECEQ